MSSSISLSSTSSSQSIVTQSRSNSPSWILGQAKGDDIHLLAQAQMIRVIKAYRPAFCSCLLTALHNIGSFRLLN